MTGNQISYLSMVGFPNTGKNSILQSFKKDHLNKAAGVHELPLDKHLRLKEQIGTLLSMNEIGPLMPKSAKDNEDFKNPKEIIKCILNIIEPQTLMEKYEIPEFNSYEDFLENIAKRNHYYIKKNFADRDRAASFILKEIIEGKLSYFTKVE